MFLFTPTMTDEQSARWDAFVGRMRVIEAEERDGEDPWLFHGTSAIRAAWIRREGFRPTFLLVQPEHRPRPDEPMGANGVNWGTVNVAAWAADRASANDDPPVMLAARLSDLRRAGILAPDHFAIQNGCSGGRGAYDDRRCPEGEPPVDPGWREGLAWSGALGVIGCVRVDGMAFHEPLADVAVHPGWAEARAERAKGSGRARPSDRMPPPGMREPTPGTHPPAVTMDELTAAAMTGFPIGEGVGPDPAAGMRP